MLGDVTVDDGGADGEHRDKRQRLEAGIDDALVPVLPDLATGVVLSNMHCKACDMVFSAVGALDAHGCDSSAPSHQCEECGARFRRPDVLRQHLRTHTGEKPYQCDVCGSSFARRDALAAHAQEHSARRFQCELCATGFKRRDHLNAHMRTHTGEKPFKCGDCGAAFAQAATLASHARTHSASAATRFTRPLKAFTCVCVCPLSGSCHARYVPAMRLQVRRVWRYVRPQREPGPAQAHSHWGTTVWVCALRQGVCTAEHSPRT